MPNPTAKLKPKIKDLGDGWFVRARNDETIRIEFRDPRGQTWSVVNISKANGGVYRNSSIKPGGPLKVDADGRVKDVSM